MIGVFRVRRYSQDKPSYREGLEMIAEHRLSYSPKDDHTLGKTVRAYEENS
jgi:hypothetical protein